MLHAEPRGRLRRRAVAVLLAFLFLLTPWLFLYSGVSTMRWRWTEPEPQGARLPAPQPVPDAYPAVVQYIPLPLEAADRWIQENYPGSLIGLDELRQIDEAAREWNVSPAILLGILGAEQSFLSPRAVGWYHALRFYENPFDYGVWPGSPLVFAIGVRKSAEGAASLVARAVLSMPARDWTQAEFGEFFRRLSGVYVHGDPGAPDADWIRNVTAVQSALWTASAASPVLWARAILSALGPDRIARLADGVRSMAARAADAASDVNRWVADHSKAILEGLGVGSATAALLALILGALAELGTWVGAAALAL